MFKHYLASALRHFAKHKTTTVINVLCLAMGLVCFMVALGITRYYSNGDLYHEKANETYVVTQRNELAQQADTAPTSPLSGWGLAPYLKQDYPGLKLARATLAQEMAVAAQGTKGFGWVAYADPEFLHIFDLNFIAGNRRTALGEPHSAVISVDFAKQLFGTTDVIGKALVLNNRATVHIAGVIDKQREPSHIRLSGPLPLFRFSMLVSMDTLAAISAATQLEAESSGNQFFVQSGLTYVAFPRNSSLTAEQVNRELIGFSDRHIPPEQGRVVLNLRHVSKINEITGDLIVHRSGISNKVMTFMFGSVVLLAACLSYANLASAQATTRLKELAMRRVVGASHRQIFTQAFCEALVLVILATGLAAALLPGMFNGMHTVLGMNIGAELFSSASFWIWMTLTIVAVALLACCYPAWVAARVQPAQALQSGRAPLTKRRVMRTLVVCQFAMASFLFVLTMVMSAQNERMRPARRGVTNDPIVVISNNLKDSGIDIQLLQNELRRESTIKSVSATDMVPGQIGAFQRGQVMSSADPASRHWLINTPNIDHDFFSTLEATLLAGRTFDRDIATDVATADGAGNVVIDRALATDYGWAKPEDAIGKSIFVASKAGKDAAGLPRTVVGVVENQMLTPLIVVGTHATLYSLSPERVTALAVRVARNDIAGGLAAIDQTWNRLAPNFPIKRKFFDEQFDDSYKSVQGVMSMFPVLALLAILVGTMGLVGIATHAIAQRRFEIGVRRTLGASAQQVLLMFLRDFSKPILTANLLAWPLAYVVAKAYTAAFADRVPITIVPFAASLLVGLVIAWLAVLKQATGASRLNPAAVLRHE